MFSRSFHTRPRPILGLATPQALPMPVNAPPVENDIDDMYYSPPAPSQEYRQPELPAQSFAQVIGPVLHGLAQAQAELVNIPTAGEVLFSSEIRI